MDISKIFSEISTYLSEYVNTTALVLSSPKKIYSLSESKDLVLTDKTKYSLPSKIYLYCLLSIFVGATIQQLIGYKHKESSDIKESMVSLLFILFVWILFISLSFLFCRLLKGKANYRTHLTVSLLVFSTSYLLCNIIAFFFYVIFKSIDRLDLLPAQLESNKAVIYIPIHFLLLAVLLNLILINLHRLKLYSSIIFILITVCMLIVLSALSLLVSPYLEMGFG